MTISVGVGGAHKTVVGMWVGVGGAWKYVTKVDVGSGGAWKLAFAPLAVSGTLVDGFDSGPSFVGTVSQAASVTVQYGSGNYTFSWVRTSTSSGNTPTISSSTVQNPTFTATVSSATPAVSYWTLTVTDTTYGISTSVSVEVNLTWEDTSGP